MHIQLSTFKMQTLLVVLYLISNIKVDAIYFLN